MAGVVGTHPSAYSKSPALWSAAFSALGIPAVYVPLDVSPAKIDGFINACRMTTRLLGFNVTVPYKERVMPFLDDIDTEARRIGAVNTVVRQRDGRLIGTNTDGVAVGVVLAGRLRAQAPNGKPPSVLILGGGGSARAAAVGASRTLPGAEIYVLNRTPDRASQVASAARGAGARVSTLSSDGLDRILPDLRALVNTTSVGMSGAIEVPGGVTWLEPFSALASAPAPVLALHNRREGHSPFNDKPPREWTESALKLIAANLEVSMRRAVLLASQAFVLDLVYAPAETVLLKHIRWTGHEGTNGLLVLVAQAIEAFLRICAPLLEGRDQNEARTVLESAMIKTL